MDEPRQVLDLTRRPPHHRGCEPNRGIGEATTMIPLEPILVTLVKLVDSIPVPPPPAKRPRGRPKLNRLFLKALVIMLVRHLHNVHALLAVLAEPTAEKVYSGLCSRNKAATRPRQHLGTPPESHAGHLASPDWLFGALLGSVDPTLGGLWAGCRHRQYDSLSQRRGLAQKRPGQRRRTAYIGGHRSPLDQIDEVTSSC